MTRGTGAEVRLEGVGKRFGEVTAVKPLDLTVRGGSLVTLLGPSGCGKTTLLRMIAGLEQASEGRIRIGGQDVTLAPASERNVSMVFQSYALFPHMTVAENVAFGLISSGVSRRDARSRVAAALDQVALGGFGERMISELSGGQQQRVALARALVLEPQVLLCDEPLSNLDTRLRRNLREEIRSLQQRLGLTVIYVTHDQSEALAVSDEIVVMRNAEIAQIGPPQDLYARPRSVFVASFMGEANHVRGVVQQVVGELATVALGPLRLGIPHGGRGPGPADVILRPEAIRIAREPDAAGLPATVTRATYMGSHTEYRLATALGDLFAVSPDRLDRLGPGAVVSVDFASDGVVLVQP